jgi:N-acetylglucosamine kinase-like BadF-type ATPase
MERGTTTAACLALAGADREADRSVVEDWAAHCRLAERVRVVNDALPLLYAVDGPVQPTGCGVALICGTGSLAFGRNSQGRTARTGGWGYLFGDEGSAFAIGQAAVRAAAQAADGRTASTVLLGRVMDRLKVTSGSELVSAIYGHPDPRSAIAGLADEVFTAAGDGDPVAAQIVDDALIQLLLMVTTLARKLNLEHSLDLFLTGGILLHQQVFRQQLLNAITRRQLTLSAVHIVAEPVRGAVRMAAQLSEANGASDNIERQDR